VTFSKARVKLTYPENLIREPIIARMVREFGVMPNIRRANVEESFGWIVCELGGDDEAVERALAWLQDLGVEVDRLGGDVVES
jgi:ABC-type methionine transport system ATPase subunit